MTPGEVVFYIAAIVIVVLIIVYGDLVRKWYSADDQKSEYHMIRTYLLNESPLYGHNKPKLWIHSKYELNARRWKSFQSRTSTDLNQPYLHLTIQSLVSMNGDDFHICLIDDDSFGKLLPTWKGDIRTLPQGERDKQRQLGLLQLLYYYGGILVPDSFVCLKPLLPLYNKATSKPFVAERLNRNKNVLHEAKQTMEFIADPYFLGCKKNEEQLIEYIEFLKDQNRSHHLHAEHDFLGNTSWWAENAVRQGHMTLLDGSVIGVKNQAGKPVLIEDLLAEATLPVSPDAFGVYIPADELLTRTAYQWFAVLPAEQIVSLRTAISQILVQALQRGQGHAKAKKSLETRSVEVVAL